MSWRKDAADVAAAIHPVLPVQTAIEHLFDAEFAEGFTLLAANTRSRCSRLRRTSNTSTGMIRLMPGFCAEYHADTHQ